MAFSLFSSCIVSSIHLLFCAYINDSCTQSEMMYSRSSHTGALIRIYVVCKQILEILQILMFAVVLSLRTRSGSVLHLLARIAFGTFDSEHCHIWQTLDILQFSSFLIHFPALSIVEPSLEVVDVH
jgi:hypothetical protein